MRYAAFDSSRLCWCARVWLRQYGIVTCGGASAERVDATHASRR